LASYVQEHDELTVASNVVVDMVQAGNLDACSATIWMRSSVNQDEN
jgi:hypothetical protein